MPQMHIPAVRPPGTVEVKIGDEWRARFNPATEEYGETLPAGAPVTHVWALLYYADKGYLVRSEGETSWDMLVIEGTDIADPAAQVARLAVERHGLTPGKVDLIGYFSCKATRHNTEFALGAETVRALYLVSVKQVSDVPEGSTYERRRLTLSEYGVALRSRYPHLELQMPIAAQRYAVMRARGEA